MAITWHLATASLYEQEQLLRAAFNLSPNIPAHYRARVSTTLPHADGTNVTEYSGNGYAPVVIPTWRIGALSSFTNDPTLPTGQQQIDFAYAVPDANVVFPDPTAQWWADGTTFYVYLTDDTTDTLRWWWQATLTPAPYPGHPLTLVNVDPADNVTPETAIGCAVQDISPAPTRLASNAAFYAITALTSMLPVNTDIIYAAVGNHFNSDGTIGAHPNEPDEPNDITFCAGFNYYVTTGANPPVPSGWTFLAGTSGEAADTGGAAQVGVSSLSDTTYVRKAVSWDIATVGGFVVCRNSAAIDWTIGADVEDHHVSGASLPSVFPGALNWSKSWPFGINTASLNTLLRGSPTALPWAFLVATADSVPASSAYIDHYDWAFFPWQPYLLAGDTESTRTNSTAADYSAWAYLFEIHGDGSAFNSSFGSLSAFDYVLATSGQNYWYPHYLANALPVQIVSASGIPFAISGQTWVAGDHWVIDTHAITFRIR